MASFGLFGKVVKDFLRAPARKHALEDSGVTAEIHELTGVNRKLESGMARVNKTLAKSKTISEEYVIARTVHDAVTTQQKVDNAAWRAEVSRLASWTAFGTTDSAVLARALANVPKRIIPRPLHPDAEKAFLKMLDDPHTLDKATKMSLDLDAMKRWEAGFVQRHIDAKFAEAQEHLDTAQRLLKGWDATITETESTIQKIIDDPVGQRRTPDRGRFPRFGSGYVKGRRY
ncbi:hypothetical protein GCM10023191_007110 [Actinoallomurus oryzae]|uniref:Uncharacterized protein n=1 Tax=Actinoallomurus oryzae TaxID=502180 RepID=A0ABP8P9K7_9ACTN